MRKHGGTLSSRDKHVTLAAISPPGVARGRFVGGQQTGLAGCKSPLLFKCGASSCSSHANASGNHGAPLHDGVHLPTYLPDEAIYVPLGCKTPIRKPGWGSMLSVVDRSVNSIPWEDLDSTRVQALQRESDGLTLGDLM